MESLAMTRKVTELEIEDGTVRGTVESTSWDAQKTINHVTACTQLTEAGIQRFVHRIVRTPLELAQLLQDEYPKKRQEELSDLIPTPGDYALEARYTCDCDEDWCAHIEAVLQEVMRKSADDIDFLLALYGLTKQDVLTEVLSGWRKLPSKRRHEQDEDILSSAEQSQDSSSFNSDLPSVQEWLAEAASQGRFHTPGPLFHDVQINTESRSELLSDDLGVIEVIGDNLEELLPGVPKIKQGYKLIIEQVRGQAKP
ncbi:hypothetical protein PASE110613_16715 [Paenibacillus sediminis]|uniref:Zn finger protein n=1 Tax=Paenibacillus sediminis TaxID=664909 RepID=A0ABS4H7V1_9BACL|nr:hypothetical protein [Paenibacillus sediminis]MBP1938541.1 putative Zn finger protein [Paenibacillus sediminis]